MSERVCRRDNNSGLRRGIRAGGRWRVTGGIGKTSRRLGGKQEDSERNKLKKCNISQNEVSSKSRTVTYVTFC